MTRQGANVPDAGHQLIHVDEAADMRMFDRLPERLREALRTAPLKISATEVAQLLQKGYSVNQLATLIGAKK